MGPGPWGAHRCPRMPASVRDPGSGAAIHLTTEPGRQSRQQASGLPPRTPDQPAVTRARLAASRDCRTSPRPTCCGLDERLQHLRRSGDPGVESWRHRRGPPVPAASETAGLSAEGTEHRCRVLHGREGASKSGLHAQSSRAAPVRTCYSPTALVGHSLGHQGGMGTRPGSLLSFSWGP